MSSERRNYFRLQLNKYLKCRMSITIIGEKVVNTEKTNVLIENIGPGGLKIPSDLLLPVKPDVIFHLKQIYTGKDIEMLGHIVWQRSFP